MFDKLCEVYGVQKVETAGDCYIAAVGILGMDEEGFLSVTEDHDAKVCEARENEARAILGGNGLVSGFKCL